MKTIIKALSETKYNPRPKWWGFVKDDLRFLCRYNHIMCIFVNGVPIYVYEETKTDKIGVKFAINYIKNEFNQVRDGRNPADSRRNYLRESYVRGTRGHDIKSI